VISIGSSIGGSRTKMIESSSARIYISVGLENIVRFQPLYQIECFVNNLIGRLESRFYSGFGKHREMSLKEINVKEQ
jgi:hypothetical protein